MKDGRGRRWAVAVLLAAGGLLAGCGSSRPAATVTGAASPGSGSSGPPAITAERPVPERVAQLPLTDQHGTVTDLAAYRGRVLVLAPFLTSCQEECPLTTGAFLAIQADLRRDGLSGQVALAELTVDPERDTPSRLAAYSAYTGADWELLTGTPATVKAFWSWFGIYYSRTPEGRPPGIDWQTHQPYTYDVAHSNGFMILGPHGNQRYLTETLPNLHGHLPPNVRRLLSQEGLSNLDHPDATAWTVPDALAAIGRVLGRRIPG